MREVILYACGSNLIVDFIEVCSKNEVEIKAIINNLENFKPEWAISIFAYDFFTNETPFLVPLFTPRNRFLASKEALDFQIKPFGLLSDRNNDLPTKFSHGNGCFINKRVVIGSHSEIGNFVLINRGACLGHHNIFEDYVSIGPGAVTGGDVTIGTGALIGVGAVILPEVKIGKQAIVGAGAVVTKDVLDYSVVLGNPAEHMRWNEKTF